VEPTIFKNVGKNSRIQQEEVFGPVVTVSYDTTMLAFVDVNQLIIYSFA
jgi:acyl-CoA reductase-like NAD-dependent aldehyde dehydrogenase